MVQLSDSGALGLLWVDLESTGSEPAYDEIIEIGAVYTDFKFSQIGDQFSRIIEPSEYALGRMMKNNVVREMHLANGLLSDCIGSMARMENIEDAEQALINWLEHTINARSRRGPIDKFRFQLAGSGVGHFDRKMIDEHMPRLSKLLTFRPYDITHVRQALKFAGVEPSADNSSSKNHRALDDINLHLEEARAYNNMFSNLLGRNRV